MKRYLAFALTALLLAGCAPASSPAESAPSSSPPADVSAMAPADISEPEPEPEPDPRQETIDGLLASMSAEEKVGQLFFACCPLRDAAALAAEYHLGGYLLFSRDFKDAAGSWLTEDQLKQTIQSYQDTAAIPMLIGADEEGGTVARASADPNLREKRFSSPQRLYEKGGLEAILADCREKDELLARLGINVNFAPVADLSTAPRTLSTTAPWAGTRRRPAPTSPPSQNRWARTAWAACSSTSPATETTPTPTPAPPWTSGP